MARPFYLLASVLLLVVLAVPDASSARSRRPTRYVSVGGGLGLSFPDDADEPHGEGGYGEGEFILAPSEWFSARAYLGAVITQPKADKDCEAAGVDCDVSAKIGYVGVKGRLTIPIPYVAPFLELGIGMSAGKMTTRMVTERTVPVVRNTEMNGVAYHIPFSIGFSVGREHNVDVSFSYLFHPEQDQITGGVGAGVIFPLGR